MIVGHKGSGKTTLLQRLLAPLARVVVIDSKADPADWVAFGRAHGYAVTSDLGELARWPRVVYRPPRRALSDRAGWHRPGSLGHTWTRALAIIRAKAPAVVVVDEGMHALSSRATHPELEAIAAQGRSLGLALWVGSQAPLYVSPFVFGEAEHLIAFGFHHRRWLDVIGERRGVDASPLSQLRRYEWAYHYRGESGWEVSGPVPPMKLATASRPVELGTTAGTSAEARNAVAWTRPPGT